MAASNLIERHRDTAGSVHAQSQVCVINVHISAGQSPWPLSDLTDLRRILYCAKEAHQFTLELASRRWLFSPPSAGMKRRRFHVAQATE